MTAPNVPELVVLDTTFNGKWRFLVGWNGLALAVQAQTGGLGTFTLNSATLGTLNNPLAGLGPLGAGWRDIAEDILSMDLHRGASVDGGVLSTYETGEVRLVLRNVDGRYNIDPAGTFTLDTTVRVLARAATILDDLEADPDLDPNDYLYRWLTGRVDDWDCSGFVDGDPVAVITVVDDQGLLNGYDQPAVTPVGSETAQARIDRVLALASWSTTDDQVPGGLQTTAAWLAGGVNPTLAASDLEGKAWQTIAEAALAAMRVAFVNGEGRVTVAPLNPNDYADWTEVTWTPGDAGTVPIYRATPRYDKAQILNVVDGKRSGGTLQTATDAGSVARFGAFRGGNTDLPLTTDAEVAVWAGFVLNNHSVPALRIEDMTIVPTFWPEYAGVDHEATVTPVTAGVPGAPFDRPLWDIVSDEVAWLNGYGRRHIVRFPDAGGVTITDTVAIRGADIQLTDDYVEITFHTSSLAAFLDVFTLNDPVQGLLSRGHRLG